MNEQNPPFFFKYFSQLLFRVSDVAHNLSGFCVLQSYCSKNMDLWWEMLVHVPLLFIEEDKEEIEISLMKFWLVINSPSWRINKILFLFSTSTITLYKILKMFILQEWHQHDVNKKLWHINECTVYRFTKKKWSHL